MKLQRMIFSVIFALPNCLILMVKNGVSKNTRFCDVDDLVGYLKWKKKCWVPDHNNCEYHWFQFRWNWQFHGMANVWNIASKELISCLFQFKKRKKGGVCRYIVMNGSHNGIWTVFEISSTLKKKFLSRKSL